MCKLYVACYAICSSKTKESSPIIVPQALSFALFETPADSRASSSILSLALPHQLIKAVSQLLRQCCLRELVNQRLATRYGLCLPVDPAILTCDEHCQSEGSRHCGRNMKHVWGCL